MGKRGIRILGGLLILIGIVLIFNSYIGITGFIIFEEFSWQVGPIFGIIFVLVGIIIFIKAERRRVQTLEGLVASGIPREKANDVQNGIKDYFSKLSKEKRKEVYVEVNSVLHQWQSGIRSGGDYNIHKIPKIPPGVRKALSGDNLYEADAPLLNHYRHQTKRGTERYLFDGDTNEFLGIAYHPGGDASKLKWRKQI
jgi:hypothetical protein